ncbi:MAG TPA: response regulator transcription factor [Candidatus Doudnabacteria bacterium]|nr:response regulator transcription factor [Candidatus Doudnabacteria bacterium]
MRVLLISNDDHFTNKLRIALQQLNYAVDLANHSNQNEFWSKATKYDLIIIEHISTEHIIKLCQEFRNIGRNMPLLAIIESLTSQEAIELFNCGIDDYTSKFSHCSEIGLRVRALLRRSGNYVNDIFKIDDLTLDCKNYSVSRGRQTVHLTRKEFGLLEYLLRHQNQVLSRTDLIEHVWDINADLFSNSLETHILNLRRKIELPNRPRLIHTISGRGYKIGLQKIAN